MLNVLLHLHVVYGDNIVLEATDMHWETEDTHRYLNKYNLF